MISQKQIRDFLGRYEEASNSCNFEKVAPLIHPKARYLFTDGTFVGISAIEKAFLKTWKNIQDEKYSIGDIDVVTVDQKTVVISYVFTSKGKVNGKLRSIKGRGTSVLISGRKGLQCIYEHLSM